MRSAGWTCPMGPLGLCRSNRSLVVGLSVSVKGPRLGLLFEFFQPLELLRRNHQHDGAPMLGHRLGGKVNRPAEAVLGGLARQGLRGFPVLSSRYSWPLRQEAQYRHASRSRMTGSLLVLLSKTLHCLLGPTQ